MTNETKTADRMSSIARKTDRRCSSCGAIIATSHKNLRMENKNYCDKCYRDCFFADTRGSRLTLEGCDR